MRSEVKSPFCSPWENAGSQDGEGGSFNSHLALHLGCCPSSLLSSVPHTKSLEGRIKEELIAQGLLESEDRPAEDSEDEVLAELRKRQAELKALNAHNRAKKLELLRSGPIPFATWRPMAFVTFLSLGVGARPQTMVRLAKVGRVWHWHG